ncbi:hypothetical protein CU097_005653 [Rhizopus azygosporus]|nr:hypothetical protein CU097_005653 [Rhizopus azygosporus]
MAHIYDLNANSIFFRDDTISDASFKVDLRILNDKLEQRYNTEYDIAIMKAAEEDPGNTKFISDRCKLSIKNKVIIDKYLMDGVNIISIDSLQNSGLQAFFVNTSLEERGPYITMQFHNHSISKSLKDFIK